MNKIFIHSFILCCFILLCAGANAQNIFPATGKVGIGTTIPATLLQVKGGNSRFGSSINYINIDTGGSLVFTGTAAYKIDSNRYVFRYTGTQAYGFYFNLTNTRYELRDSNGVATVTFGTNDGNATFKGGVKVGNSTSAVAGNIRWTGTDFQGYTGAAWKSLTIGTVYTAGSDISISSNVITNTAPDKVVTITPSNGIKVTGSYPNFTIGNIATPWFVTGNAGTNPAVNFIGTTGAQPLVFKVNNARAGYLDYNGNDNTSFGYQGLLANTAGYYNTAIGYGVLKANTSGARNTGIGFYALTAGNADNNTAIGTYSLSSNTSGLSNVATGVNALGSNTQGSYNSAYGTNSLYTNTTGIENTASGFEALYSNQGGNDNAAYGKYALYTNTSGNFNTALGWNAMFFNVSGNNNTATGSAALQNNGTGSFNSAYGNNALYSNNGGSYNVANGNYALYNNTSGIENIAIGDNALAANTGGSYNTAIGGIALFSNTANYNTATGYGALYTNGTGSGNTATGSSALYLNSTGYENTAVGYNAMYANSTGYQNSAVGDFALGLNNTGFDNVAHGFKALYGNTSGYENTGIGFEALSTNIGGTANTAVGKQALFGNSTGYSNTATGKSALFFNTSGSQNTANGDSALFSNTKGTANTAIGYTALSANKDGTSNTATGYQSLYSNIAGSFNTANGDYALSSSIAGSNNSAFGNGALISNTGSNNTLIGFSEPNTYYIQSGSDNTAVGSSSLENNVGYQNTAIGRRALYSTFLPGGSFGSPTYPTGIGNTATGFQASTYNVAGNYNTANGFSALLHNLLGNYNTAVGANALSSDSSGSFNVAVGYNADIDPGITNSINIGVNVHITHNNEAVIGNPATVDFVGPIYLTVSDGRFKKDINENVPGLDFIKSLRPVSYRYKSHELQQFLMQNNAKRLADANSLDYTEAESKVHLGFIAQDVEKVMNEKGYKGNIVKTPANANDNYGLAYSEFIAPMVKGIQELSKQSDSVKNAINNQPQINAALQKQIDDLKSAVLEFQQKQEQCSPCSAAAANTLTNNTDGAALEQNTPNPFTHTTTISYTLPQKFTTAQIMITDKNGKTLKIVNVSGSGKGSVNVDASVLAAGAYNYSLLVDGKLVGTKQMVLAR